MGSMDSLGSRRSTSRFLLFLSLGCVLLWGTLTAQTLTTPALAQPQAPPVVTVPGSVSPPPAADVHSQPAVAVTEVKSPAAPAHYTDQALWALMVSFLIQWLKKSPWFGWITPETSSRIKTQFGFLVALLTAAGIHFAVSGSLLDGGGASITVSGLSLNALKDVAWQWTAQQAWYQAVVKDAPPLAPPRLVLAPPPGLPPAA